MSMGEGRCLATSAPSSPPPVTWQRVQGLFGRVEPEFSLSLGNGLAGPAAAPHMMMRGSGTDSLMDLWGSTLSR